MKAILDLKKERDDSIFYRYNIDGTQVWFEQYKDSGNIYMVTVRPGDELRGDFSFYAQDGSLTEHYYPEYVEINTNHERLTVDQIDEYVSRLSYAKKIAEAIMDIFDYGEHMELYNRLHKEEIK